MKLRIVSTLLGMLFGFLLALPSLAAHKEKPRARAREDFFIVSSVDTKKKQLVLKRPTEVTELVLVTGKTLYLDEEGKPLGFSDFRAGDTVYVTSSPDAGLSAEGARVATRIRKAPMTLEELHRRYLDFK